MKKKDTIFKEHLVAADLTVGADKDPLGPAAGRPVGVLARALALAFAALLGGGATAPTAAASSDTASPPLLANRLLFVVRTPLKLKEMDKCLCMYVPGTGEAYLLRVALKRR